MSFLNIKSLCLVMPFYNESGCLRQVCTEWLETLRKTSIAYKILLVDDGSTDGSAEISDKLSRDLPGTVEVIHIQNVGHGQACVAGYNKALIDNFEWVLQVDSDGQCPTESLSEFLENAKSNHLVYGFRKYRDDGVIRLLFSRIFTYSCYLATGFYIKDPNVPYRLMHKDYLLKYIRVIPADFYLANVALSFLHVKHDKVQWINIHFRERVSGASKAGYKSMLMRFLVCIRNLQYLNTKDILHLNQ